MTKHILILVLLIAAAGWLVRPTIKPGPFTYDESDYMHAARFTPVAHWMDFEAMPFSEFLHMGLTRGRDPQQRLALSEAARASDDPNVYRHYHGPVFWYWLGFLRQFTVDEFALRCWSLFFPFLTLLMIYFGSLRVLPDESRQLGALLASVLFAWSPITLGTTDLAPHPVFVFFYITALLLAAKIMTGTGTRNDWYAAVVAAGAAFCTLEVTFVLVAALAICAWRRRYYLQVNPRFILTSAGVFLATVLALWPAGLLKLDFLKSYLFMAYLALFRRDAWSQESFASIWAMRLALSPVEWLLVAAGLILLAIRWRRPEARAAEVFLWFGLLMLAAMARVNGYGPRYLTPYMAAFEVLAGWMIAGALTELRVVPRYALLVVLIGGLAASSAQSLARVRPVDDLPLRAAIASIHTEDLDHGTLFAPHLLVPVFHYYLPAARVHSYLDLPSVALLTAAGPNAVIVQKDGAFEIQRVPSQPPSR